MINNSNFLEKEIPIFHPITQKYDRLEYWREQKRRIIEGYWSGGKWMPPELYYYVNFHTITFEDGAFRGTGRPWLRDIEWEKGYIYAEATGFSGFELDTENTCHRWYGPEKEKALKYGWITEEELAKKKYIPAREYLRKIHPKSLGKPLYLNEAKHIIDLECFAPGTEVLMYDGTVKNIEDVRIGDQLMGPDSKPRNVLHTHNGIDDMYEVKSKRFGSYVCNSKHKIALIERKRINGKYINGVRQPGYYEKSKKSVYIQELIDKQDQASFHDRFYLYQADRLDFDNGEDPSIDPYMLGYWLSDGRSNTISVKSTDESCVNNLTEGNRIIEIHDAVDNRKRAFEIKWYKKHNPELYEAFKPMLYNKHIPHKYKTASFEYRMHLLAGIIDGDGCLDKHGNYIDVYAGLNKTLADDIAFLARTLGFYSNVTMRQRDGYSDTYEIVISGDIWNIPVRYERKKANPVKRRIDVKRSSFSINPVGKGEFYGIEVDGDHLFLLSNCVSVHNSRGGGKDLYYKTPVYTTNGPVNIIDVNVGDEIFGGDGKLTTVVDKRILTDQLQYRVTFSDGRSIICGGGHLWTVRNPKGIRKTVELNDIKDNYFTVRATGVKDYKYAIPMAKPIEYSDDRPDIDPYYFGLWLGDGNKHNTGITTMDDEIVDFLYDYKDRLGMKKINIQTKPGNKASSYTITNGRVNTRDPNNNQLLNKLRILGVLNNKHIPDSILYTDIEYRLEVLRGLMDSDGYVGHNGQYQIVSSYPKIADSIAKLLQGLGIRYKTREKIISDKYRTTVFNFVTNLDVVKLSRKKSKVKKSSSKYGEFNRNYVKIVNIEPLEVMKSVCIAVNNEDKLFVAGDYIVTHNSFWASGCIVHNFITDGARDYDMYLERREAGNPLKSEGIVGAINAIYSNDLLAKVKVGFAELPDKQIINTGRYNEIFPSPLAVHYTGSLAPSRFIIASKSGSILHHRTFGDNPLAANATRPNRVWLDEVGFMDNVKAAWEGIEATQASAQFKRLTIHAMGTGGLTQGGAALYVQEMFYNPEAYGALVFDDIWEDKGKIGYFLSGEYTMNRFKKGKNYITDFDMAKEYIEDEREEARQSGSMTKLMGTIINKPQKPSEIFLRAEGVFFQVADLKYRLSELESSNSILNATYKYDFNLREGKVTPSVSQKRPIRDFPLPKGMEMDAPVELFELPKRLPDGSIPSGRYIAGWDPVSSDGNEDTERSLQSMFIFDTWTDRIVAEYTARTYLHEDYYEQARRLLIYFNARCNYEKNIRGPYAYFKNKDSLYLLVETPEILKDMSLATSKPTVGNAQLGTQTNQEITNWGLSLIKTWLEQPAYDDNQRRNVEKLMSPGLAKELISYNPDINVDRIMALIMVMILREDRRKITEMMKEESINAKSKDKFWDRAFMKNSTPGFNRMALSL